MERLQKYLSSCGVASRRKSEELILEGKVKVNGKVVRELGTQVSSSDIVMVNEVEIKKEDKVYFLLYKPEKTICSLKDEKGRKTVVELIQTVQKIFPLWILDYDTSGIILLTNDGELTNILTHPSHDVYKTYYTKVDGIVTGEEIKMLEKGIILDGVKTKKAYAKIKKIDKKNNKSYVELTISEGRNHQVKNMFMAIGHKVLKLKRTDYAFLNLDGLSTGEYRPLNIKEIKKLYSLK